MTLPNLSLLARRRGVATICALGALIPHMNAQSAQALAKYDQNGNGVLDPSELAAQQADEAKTGTVVLTPFQVNTDKDSGYAAGNSLAGGRADTPLKITPASISVMTKEFMDDFNITDMNQAAAWTLSMEPPTGGESGAFGGNRFQSNFRNAGGGGNYPSRNYALFYYVSDSYNTERFEFSRGPNALLFGDAGVGGTQGATTKQARFNDRRTSVTLRGDTFGGYRSTLDTSYGFDRFAVRVNLLHQDIKAYQDHTSSQQTAITVATSFKLSANTQLRAEFERNAEHNVQYRRSYAENASFWNRGTRNLDNVALLGNVGATLNAQGLEQVSATTDYLVYNFAAPQYGLLNYKGNQYRTRGLGYQIPWQGRPDLPNFKDGVSKKFNLGPADSIADRDLNYKAVYLDHRFTDDLFAQIAWLSHDIDPYTENTEQLANDYRIDVNQLLPNGQPNPGFNRAYADVGQSTQYQQNGVDDYRIIATYRFALPKLLDLKQRLSLNAGYRIDLYEAHTQGIRWVSNPLQASPQNAANQYRYRVYWDQPNPSVKNLLPPPTPGYTFRKVDTGFTALNDRRLSYGQLVSQTTFWDDRIAVTLGWRRDKNEDDVLGNIGFDAAGNVILGAQNPVTLINEAGRHGRLTSTKDSKNAGIALYPIPSFPALGFTANYSENFTIPSTGAPLISGARPGPPVGQSEEYGVRFSLPDNKAYATLTRYDTKQLGVISGFGTQNEIRDIWTNLGYTDIERTQFTARDLSSNNLKGWEFELVANPSRNLTLTVNHSRPKRTVITDSEDRQVYVAANLAEWRAGAAATAGDVINGRTILNPLTISQRIQTIQDSLNGLVIGALANNTNRHSTNLAGSYRFLTGSLKGLAMNAGLNLRGHRKVGSRDAQIKFNTTAPTPAQNREAAFDYLWVQSTVQASAGINYTRRFGKTTARFQINVANLLDDDDPQWNSYSTIAANQLLNGNARMQVLSGFSHFDPRKFTFTTTLSF